MFGIQKLSVTRCLNANKKWYCLDYFKLIWQHFEQYSNNFETTFHFWWNIYTTMFQRPNNSSCSQGGGGGKFQIYKSILYYWSLKKKKKITSREFVKLLCDRNTMLEISRKFNRALSKRKMKTLTRTKSLTFKKCQKMRFEKSVINKKIF